MTAQVHTPALGVCAHAGMLMPSSALVRKHPFCSGSWSLADSQARTVPEAAFAEPADRACRGGGSDAALVSPPWLRAPGHGAVPRGQAGGFLLSPICGITSPTDFANFHTVCCTPPRRREGGR